MANCERSYSSSSDEFVTLTNDEATCSKKYAVSKSYWRDPYINAVCRQSVKKTPEISRGYFARVYAVRSLVEQFIKLHENRCQIISLGAGYDTLFWNLKDCGLTPSKYIEVDLSMVTRHKTSYIQSKKEQLLEALGEDVVILEAAKLGLLSQHYALLPADLTNLTTLEAQFSKASVNFSLPTLFLTECVLMYLPQSDSDHLLSYLSDKFAQAHIVNYDVMNMTDKFAEVMLANLGARQCTLYVQDCISAETQTQRFKRCGWKSCSVSNMNDVYSAIPSEERTRIEQLELLDEVHLLSELMMHYCICTATNTDQLLLNCDSLSTSIGA